MYRVFIIIVLATLASLDVHAQIEGEQTHTEEMFVPTVKVGKVLQDGDSIQYVEMTPLYIYPTPDKRTAKEQKRYDKLVRDVKKVLPIAKEVHGIIIETYEYTVTLSKKERAEHMKLVEKEIKRTYTPRMKKLTFSQGKLLIKLVYRESGSTGFQLVNAFLGPIRAGFYQAFAAIFGASLKKSYDAEGEDKEVERVVRQVEAGQI